MQTLIVVKLSTFLILRLECIVSTVVKIKKNDTKTGNLSQRLYWNWTIVKICLYNAFLSVQTVKKKHFSVQKKTLILELAWTCHHIAGRQACSLWFRNTPFQCKLLSLVTQKVICLRLIGCRAVCFCGVSIFVEFIDSTGLCYIMFAHNSVVVPQNNTIMCKYNII